MINYLEKGEGLQFALDAAGYALRLSAGVYTARDLDGNESASIDIAVQAIIDAYDPLPDYKAIKIEELKIEGLSRIQVALPAIQTFDDLQLVKEQFLSIKAASRSATTAMQAIIDLYTAGVAGISAINSLTTGADIKAFDVVNDVAW